MVHVSLKALMVKNNLKNEDVSKIIGCSPSTFSLKINGKYDFTISEIEKLKEYFGLTYEEIFFNQPIRRMSINDTA